MSMRIEAEVQVESALMGVDFHVNLINDINTRGLDSAHLISGATQAQANAMVQISIDAIEDVLAWDGSGDNPDVAGNSEDKSAYTNAVSTGNTYIQDNS